MSNPHETQPLEMPSLSEVLQAAAAPRLAAPREHCPTHHTRALMHEAVDQSLQQNLQYIDQLIEKLGAMKSRMVHEAGLVSEAIANHYAFAAESLAFADLVHERLASIARNGGNSNGKEESQALAAIAAGEGGAGGDGDEPVRGLGAGAFMARRGG